MDKKYIIAGALLVITVILGIILVNPKYQEFSAFATTLSDKQAELDKGNQTVAAITKVFDSYKKASQNISRVNALLPVMDAQSIPKLFIEMEGLASQNGLSLKSLSFAGGSISSAPASPAAAEAGKQQKAYKVISVKLSVQGSYASLKQFGDAVESNEHLMDIISFSIVGGSAQASGQQTGSANAAPASGAKKSAESDFSSSMSIDTYYQ